jgi:hypothetical protein
MPPETPGGEKHWLVNRPTFGRLRRDNYPDTGGPV